MVVRISKAAKRGSFSDNTAKRIVFTETRNTLVRVLASIFFSSIGTQFGAKHPTSPLGHLSRKITKNIECFVVAVVGLWLNVPVNSYGNVETVS